MVRRPFDVLGIEVTRDTKQIKKAYAALVRQYHPEEHPTEWGRIHEAYETAMAYAEGRQQDYIKRQEEWRIGLERADGSGQETEDEVLNVRDREVVENAEYGTIFQEVQTQWIQEKIEREQKLRIRLEELGKLPEKHAVKEWKHFFAEEFLPGEDTESLMLLLEILRKYPLPKKALQLIEAVMKERLNDYNAKERSDCSDLVREVIRLCAYKPVSQRREGRKTFSWLWIFAVFAVCICAAGIARQRSGYVSASDVSEKAAVYLNEKYGQDRYMAEMLRAEKITLFTSEEDRIESYKITVEDSEGAAAYAVRYLEAEDDTFAIFDNIQAEEIRQAFEARINERTGHAEGKLFWNSETDGSMSGGIGNGMFRTKYEGDFDAFIEEETQARQRAPKGVKWSVSSAARPANGVCDYYIQDSTVQTMREKFEGKEFPEDAGLLEVLEGCAADYRVQLQGIALPGNFFEEKMRQAAWDDTEMSVYGDVAAGYSLEPSIPFLMLTGWYVALPPEKEELSDIHNSMYARETVQMGSGIYGAESSIRTYPFETESEWNFGSMQKVETPANLGLTEEKRKKAVSFQLAPGTVLSNDCCLAIDKEVYGIADAGYQVFISDGVGTDWSEASVSEYEEVGVKLKYGHVLDGEGFVFLEYHAVENGTTAEIVTIVNP